jgi:hypothetical protein
VELDVAPEYIARWALALASEGGFDSDENYRVRAADWKNDQLVWQCAELIRLTRGETTGVWASDAAAIWYSSAPRPSRTVFGITVTALAAELGSTVEWVTAHVDVLLDKGRLIVWLDRGVLSTAAADAIRAVPVPASAVRDLDRATAATAEAERIRAVLAPAELRGLAQDQNRGWAYGTSPDVVKAQTWEKARGAVEDFLAETDHEYILRPLLRLLENAEKRDRRG